MGESNETLRKAGAVLPIAPIVFGGVLASGGEVSPGVTYWAGDVPEFFTPKSAGTVTPLSKLAQLNTQLAGKTSETSNTQLAGKASETSAIPRFAEGGIVTEPTTAVLGDDGDEAVIPLQGTGTNVFSRLLQRLTPTGQSFSKIFEGAGQDAINETVSGGHGTHRPIHAIVDNWPAALSGKASLSGATDANGNLLHPAFPALGTVPDLRTVGLSAITNPSATPGQSLFGPTPQAQAAQAPALLPPLVGSQGWFAKLFGGETGSTATSASTSAVPSFAFASDFGGFLAEGGDADPGKVYGVAEAGEAELFMPRSAGSVTPLSKLSGGDTYHTWQIDARGADLGVANRLDEIMNGVHNSAIVSSIRASAEMAKRRPRMS
jgi:hypothetical protein